MNLRLVVALLGVSLSTSAPTMALPKATLAECGRSARTAPVTLAEREQIRNRIKADFRPLTPGIEAFHKKQLAVIVVVYDENNRAYDSSGPWDRAVVSKRLASTGWRLCRRSGQSGRSGKSGPTYQKMIVGLPFLAGEAGEDGGFYALRIELDGSDEIIFGPLVPVKNGPPITGT